MTNKTIPYNTGKAVTRNKLNSLIQDAEGNGNWSRVEQANVSKVKDISSLFEGVKGIKDLNLDGWDTSNVTNMRCMFYGSDYNHPLHFDTSKVEDMAFMFCKSNYNFPLLFDTSNVKNIAYMFYDSKYNYPLNFIVARACPERERIGYDTSNVTNMAYMFANSRYNHPLHFDTSNVENMSYMFYGSDYNHPLKFDISNVKSMGGIFDNSSIAHPIVFNGGNIPDDVQAFIDENNAVYEDKRKLEDIVHNKCDTNEVVVSQSFKL